MFTKREIDYFANLGEMLGYHVFVEDYKFDKIMGRSRPMDLSWWKSDERIDKENFVYLALHLERENQWNNDVDTIEKLFAKTDEGFVPHIYVKNVPSKLYKKVRCLVPFASILV
jgi:nucleosome binding factor SPN SPT16 subunit